MAKFNKNDDSLVVIIGSGAGGGTLGYELAKKLRKEPDAWNRCRDSPQSRLMTTPPLLMKKRLSPP